MPFLELGYALEKSRAPLLRFSLASTIVPMMSLTPLRPRDTFRPLLILIVDAMAARPEMTYDWIEPAELLWPRCPNFLSSLLIGLDEIGNTPTPAFFPSLNLLVLLIIDQSSNEPLNYILNGLTKFQ